MSSESSNTDIRGKEIEARQDKLDNDFSLLDPPALFEREMTCKSVDDDVFRPLESFPTLMWYGSVSIAGGMASIFFFCFAWIKASVPRYRYDQLMRLGWKVFLPVSLIWVVLTSSYLVFFGKFSA